MEKNKLYFGDCLDVMKEISDKTIDMVLCDLPYGSSACEWDIIIPFDELWSQYERIIKDNGVIVLFGVGMFAHKLAVSNEKLFKYEMVWDKEQGTNQFLKDVKPLTKHELILIFGKGKNTYNPIMIKSWRREIKIRKETVNQVTGTESKIKTNYDSKGLKYPITILPINRDHWRGIRYHPTQKPVLLCEYLIQTYSNKGDLILDNCAGSGTTGVAAINMNRKFILIEKDYNWFKVAELRLKKHMAKDK